MGSVRSNSWLRRSPSNGPPLSIVGLKKLRMNVRAALGSEEGRKGSNRNGMSNAMSNQQPGLKHKSVSRKHSIIRPQPRTRIKHLTIGCEAGKGGLRLQLQVCIGIGDSDKNSARGLMRRISSFFMT